MADARYREPNIWSQLAANTRASRETVFRQLIDAAGQELLSRLTRKVIIAGRDRRSPGAAVGFVGALRALMKWAYEAGHVEADPAAGIKATRKKTEGFRTWTEEEMAAYEQHWPIGTRERVWFDILAYTGLRRSDAVRLGRGNLRNGIISIRTKKTDTPVTMPLHPSLARSLEAGPIGDMTFIVGAMGKPMTASRFYNAFIEAARSAGISGSPHGVRKRTATRAAHAGASESELEAIMGWHGGQMASLYTRAADRERLAKAGMGKVIRIETSIRSPSDKVRAQEPKDE